jgi:lipopolysaccharide/colanic/teichoic acid biosynthesis glycosyltransferase
LIIGDNDAVVQLVDHIADDPRTGYKIIGVITKQRLPLTIQDIPVFSSLHAALEVTQPDVVMQTDTNDSNTVYETAIDHHLLYQYIPSHKALATSRHSSDVVAGLPIITVHTTPLVGYGRVVKRIFDLAVSIPAVIILSPVLLLLALAVKIGDPKGAVFMTGVMANRVTRFNRVFRLYKFRSHYAKFDGKTDEEVFRMVGKPELIKEYRKNGDKLKNDFRVTPVGRFIRRTSLDELPQLFNVIKGDLSLVGPRALVPHELDKFEKWHTILSVKSGMTGLAIVSGRRNISFEERRNLDLYYVQNWCFWFDIAIIIRTLRVVFAKEES